MTYDNETAKRRMSDWVDTMERFALPGWEDLPQLELYMDQVIILLKQYLGPLTRGGEEKAITASIINNYVRLKVLPPPVKKKYTRVHLACLIIICILKQNLSIACIQRMLPEAWDSESVARLYSDFVERYRLVSDTFVRQVRCDTPLLSDGGNPVTSAAIISNLSKSLTEALLLVEPEGD